MEEYYIYDLERNELKGFTYDYGPHVSFTNDAYIKELFATTVNGDFLTHKVLNAKKLNYLK